MKKIETDLRRRPHIQFGHIFGRNRCDSRANICQVNENKRYVQNSFFFRIRLSTQIAILFCSVGFFSNLIKAEDFPEMCFDFYRKCRYFAICHWLFDVFFERKHKFQGFSFILFTIVTIWLVWEVIFLITLTEFSKK